MGQRAIKQKVCDRCLKDTLASTTIRFSIGDTEYEIDVCEKHADMFQRDMHGWTRVSREKEKPSFLGRSQVELDNHRRLVRAESDRAKRRTELKEADPQLETIPGPALDWTLSTHAEEQLAARGPAYGFSKREVLLAAHSPQHSYAADDGVCYRHNRGPVSCVVDRQRQTIVTVMPNLPNWGDNGEQKNQELAHANSA